MYYYSLPTLEAFYYINQSNDAFFVCFQCFFSPVFHPQEKPTRPGGCTSRGSNWSRFIRALRIEECGGLLVRKKKLLPPEMVF